MRYRKHLLILGLASVLLTGCAFQKQAEEDTIYVEANGLIRDFSIEDFNESYYDEKELKSYITDSIKAYVKSNGDGTVELKEFKVEEDNKKEDQRLAQLSLEYSTYIDYAQFNDTDFFIGSLGDAAKKYDLGPSLWQVENEKVGRQQALADVSGDLEDTGAQAVVLRNKAVLQVPGTIIYVSDPKAELLSKDRVKINSSQEAEPGPLVCVIYQ